MSDIEKVMEVLDLHRWKTMGATTVECECGLTMGITGGVDFIDDRSLVDAVFRNHIAKAVVAQISQFTPEMIREVMEIGWDQGADYVATQFTTDINFTKVDPAMNPYHRE